MTDHLLVTTPAQPEAARAASVFGLDNHGLAHLGRLYWNLPEPALYEEAIFRREGHVAAEGPFRGAWEFTVSGAPGGGSELTVTERGEIGNPLVRFASRYMFGREAYLDLYLAEVRARLGDGAPAP